MPLILASLLLVAVSQPPAVKPALPFPLTVHYSSLEGSATNVTLTLDVEGALGYRSLPPNCTAEGSRATCALGDIPNPIGFPPRELAFEPIAPDESQRLMANTAELRSDETSVSYTARMQTFETFFVTTTADEGEGSLREAIHQVNRSCALFDYCLLAFRIPGGTGPWHTIQPHTPLPPIGTGSFIIDGFSQTEYYGDTNPAGPEIELRGDALAAGNGLEITVACAGTIRGLAINRFPGAGLRFVQGGACGDRAIFANYIGTDPTGSVALGNERGIVADGGGFWHLRQNVISGNRRSGVFVRGGVIWAEENIVGLDAKLTKPLGNGASGFYYGPGTGGHLRRNYIGFNAHSGISVDRRAGDLGLAANSIQGNGQLAIDRGLDGPSDEDLSPPVILSAIYDPATNTTTLSGFAEVDVHDRIMITLYANDAVAPHGFGEAQYYLGYTMTENRRFSLTVEGDWRHKYASASASRVMENPFSPPFPVETSEISRAVEVR